MYVDIDPHNDLWRSRIIVALESVVLGVGGAPSLNRLEAVSVD